MINEFYYFLFLGVCGCSIHNIEHAKILVDYLSFHFFALVKLFATSPSSFSTHSLECVVSRVIHVNQWTHDCAYTNTHSLFRILPLPLLSVLVENFQFMLNWNCSIHRSSDWKKNSIHTMKFDSIIFFAVQFYTLFFHVYVYGIRFFAFFSGVFDYSNSFNSNLVNDLVNRLGLNWYINGRGGDALVGLWLYTCHFVLQNIRFPTIYNFTLNLSSQSNRV